MIGLTVFILAIFLGFELITKVPPTLHTPLMSGANAISGITLVGALSCAYVADTLFEECESLLERHVSGLHTREDLLQSPEPFLQRAFDLIVLVHRVIHRLR